MAYNRNRNRHPELRRDPIVQPGDGERVLLQDDAAEYPAGWDMEVFKNLPSYKARGQYAKEKLGKLGTGSARVVFEINDDTVLKLARNAKGLAQNELEADISSSRMYEDFVTDVRDVEPNYLWIESEKAHKMSKSDFKRLVGFKFEDFVNAIRNESEANQGKRHAYLFNVHPEVASKIFDSELFNNIVSFIYDYDLLAADFQRLSSWGIVNRQGHEVPVLIDYGISQNMYNDLYLRK